MRILRGNFTLKTLASVLAITCALLAVWCWRAAQQRESVVQLVQNYGVIVKYNNGTAINGSGFTYKDGTRDKLKIDYDGIFPIDFAHSVTSVTFHMEDYEEFRRYLLRLPSVREIGIRTTPGFGHDPKTGKMIVGYGAEMSKLLDRLKTDFPGVEVKTIWRPVVG